MTAPRIRRALQPIFLLVLSLLALGVASPTSAFEVYRLDFESFPLGITSAPGGGLDHSSTLPSVTWTVAADNGANGTRGLTADFDSTGVPNYFVGFRSPGVLASDISPIGNSSAITMSQIRFSFDIKSVGHLNGAQMFMGLYQDDPSYEADRGIDANGDGDMTDLARNFESSFRPLLESPGQFAHVSVTLDQGQLSANIASQNGVISLPPAFDPTVQLRWAIGFASPQFGSDAGNSVTVDNFVIEVIPEPATITLLLSSLLASALHRRRLT